MKIINTLLIKFLFVLGLVCLGFSSVNGQVDTLLNENFSNGLPSGWTDGNNNWDFSVTGEAKTTPNSLDTEGYLQSKNINASSYDYLELVLDYEYQTYSPDDLIFIDISKDGGNNFYPQDRIILAGGVGESFDGIQTIPLSTLAPYGENLIIQFGAELDTKNGDKPFTKYDNIILKTGGVYKTVLSDSNTPPENISDLDSQPDCLPILDSINIYVGLQNFLFFTQNITITGFDLNLEHADLDFSPSEISYIKQSFSLDETLLSTDYNPNFYVDMMNGDIELSYEELIILEIPIYITPNNSYTENTSIIDVLDIDFFLGQSIVGEDPILQIGNCCENENKSFNEGDELPFFYGTNGHIEVNQLEIIDEETVNLQAKDYIELKNGFETNINSQGSFKGKIASCSIKEIENNTQNSPKKEDYLPEIHTNKLKIYPNPFKDSIFITISELEKVQKIELIDLLQRQAIPSFSTNQSNTNYKVNTISLLPGMYVLKIRTDLKDYIYKVIKIN